METSKRRDQIVAEISRDIIVKEGTIARFNELNARDGLAEAMRREGMGALKATLIIGTLREVLVDEQAGHTLEQVLAHHSERMNYKMQNPERMSGDMADMALTAASYQAIAELANDLRTYKAFLAGTVHTL